MGLFDRPSSVNFKDESAKFQESLQESLIKELQEAKNKEAGIFEEDLSAQDRIKKQKESGFLKNIFENNPESLLKKPVIRLLTGQGIIKPSERIDPNYKDTEIQKIVRSGLGRAAYSTADALALLADVSLPSELAVRVFNPKLYEELNLGKNFNEKIDKIYLNANIEDPETALGEIGSVLIEYGIPTTMSYKFLQNLVKVGKFAGKKITQTIKKPKSGPWGAIETVVKQPKPISGIAKIARNTIVGGASFAGTEFLAGSREGIEPFDKIPIPDFITKATGLEDIELDKLESLEGLTGDDLIAAKFKNRLLYLKQGGSLGLVFPIAGKILKGAGKISGYAGSKLGGFGMTVGSRILARADLIPYSKTITREVKEFAGVGVDVIREPISKILKLYANRGTGDLFRTLPKFEKWRKFDITSTDPVLRRLKKLDKYTGLEAFRSASRFTVQEFTVKSGAEKFLKSENKKVQKYLDSIYKNIYGLAKSFGKQYDAKMSSPALQEQQLEMVLEFIKGQRTVQELPEVLREAAKGLEKSVTKIKKRYFNLMPDGELKNFMQQDIKSYMKKSFSLFTTENFTPNPFYKEKAIDWIQKNVIEKNKDLKESALREGLKNGLTQEEAIRESARKNLEQILLKGKAEGKDPLKNMRYISNNLLRLDKFVATGEELPKAIRKVLGEEKGNLRSDVLLTTTEMLTQSTNKILYDELGALGLKEGWLFENLEDAVNAGVSGEKINSLAGLRIEKYGLTSKTAEKFASNEIAETMRTGKQLFDSVIQSSLYLGLLQAKAVTQYGLTVLSPATQVRNVLSASMFALFNGHIGGNASLTNAFTMVADDIFGAGKVIDEAAFIERISRKVELGVMDENVVSTELRKILDDVRSGKIGDTESFIETLSNIKFTSKATELYGGGDNLWKFFGHEFVMSQLRPAMIRNGLNNFDDVIKYHKEIMGVEFNPNNIYSGTKKTMDEAIEEMAAWSIRNTYPTYSMVPPIIQAIRRLPIGNFVAFPAEMWRTSYNALEIAMKEISSSDPIIREMGYRRLMGGVTVHGGYGVVAPAIASNLTGITQEFMNDYKRDLGANWERDSDLVPMSKMGTGDRKGMFKYVNLSYFNPYAMVQAPFKKMYKFAFSPKDRYQPGEVRETFIDALFNFEDGAITGVFKPFLSEAIVVEKMLDILPAGKGGRGGVTKTGTRLYGEYAEWGEISSVGVSHFLKGVQPGALRTVTRIGQGLSGSKYIDPENELINLFTGIKLQEGNISDKFSYTVYDYNLIPRETKINTIMYDSKSWEKQTPGLILNDFIDQQEEAFKAQYKIYQTIQTAFKAGFTESEIRKMLTKTKTGNQRISNTQANILLQGKFVPMKVAEGRMEGKILDLKGIEKERGKYATGIFTYEKNEDYYYPKQDLKDIYLEYKQKKFDEYKELNLFDVYQNPDLREEYEYQQKKPDLNISSNQEIQTPPLPLPGNPEEITTVAQSTIPVANQGRLGITNKARINEFGNIVKNTTV